MKTTKILSAALIVFAAAACNSDYISESRNTGNLEPMVISGAQTKTVFNQNADDLNGTVSWTAGDQIAIYDNLGGRNVFKNSTDAPASFSGDVTAGTTEFWGVYPATRVSALTNGVATVSLPAEQAIAAGTFAEEFNISVAHGTKTPGTPEVSGVSFHNVLGIISFDLPARVPANQVTFTAKNRDVIGTMTIDCNEEAPSATIVADGSASVTMSGTFPAGSRFYFVVAPGKIEGFEIEVKTAKGSQYSRGTNAGVINVIAGGHTHLPNIDFADGPVSATAEHTINSGVLEGTSLTVNHGIPAYMLGDVTALNLSVSKDGTTYRSISTSSVSEESVALTSGKVYLPKGTYSISGSYTMNGVVTPINGSFSVPAPQVTLKATVEGTTSYSLSKTDATAANEHDAETISSPACTISGVSAAVLAECPATCTFSVDGQTKTGTATSSRVTVDNFTGLTTWGAKTLSCSVNFEGVAANGSTICHITGLPYSYDFYGKSLDAARGESWTDKNVEYANSKCRIKRDDVNGYMISPKFYIPESFTVKYSVGAQYYRAWAISVSSKSIDLRIGVTSTTDAVASQFTSHQCKGNNNTGRKYEAKTGSLTISAGTPYISIHHNNAEISGQIDELSIEKVSFTY